MRESCLAIPGQAWVDLLSDVMREEADPSHIESSSSNHRDAKGEKWICGDTSGLTTHASSRSEKPADIKIPHSHVAQSGHDSYLLEALPLVDATGDLSAFRSSVQISPRTVLWM